MVRFGAGELVGWLVTWLVGLPTLSWSAQPAQRRQTMVRFGAGELVGWLAGWLVGWLVRRAQAC